MRGCRCGPLCIGATLLQRLSGGGEVVSREAFDGFKCLHRCELFKQVLRIGADSGNRRQ